MSENETGKAVAKKKKEKLSPEVIARLQALPRSQDIEEVLALPVWVKMALIRRITQNLTYKEAAKKANRAASTLESYSKSPAAKKWVARISELLEDPVALSYAILQEGATDVAADRFLIFEAAKEAEDWKLADAIARDLQDRMGVVTKKAKSEEQALTLKINLGGIPLDVPVIEAEYEVVTNSEEDEDV